MNTPSRRRALEHKTAVIDAGPALDVKSAAAFRLACQEHLDAGAAYFIVDFSKTNWMDSTGLGAIFTLRRKLTARSTAIIFAGVTGQVQLVVRLTGAERIFPQFDTVEEAREALRELSENHSGASDQGFHLS